MIVWILSGVMCLVGALCYAELGKQLNMYFMISFLKFG